MSSLPLVSHQSITSALRRIPVTSSCPASGFPTGSGPVLDALCRALLQQGIPPAETSLLLGQLGVALNALGDEEENSALLTAVQNPLASALQSYLAERAAIGESNSNPASGSRPPGGYKVKFDHGDLLGWIGSFFSWWRGLIPHVWLPPADAPELIPDRLRVAVLGDWGTGLYGAPACAHSIMADSKGFDLYFHLGDVYYSGTASEIKERFLNLWPGDNARGNSRACNGNHEMYSGGHGYFDSLLPAFGQASSCFALQNEHWLLVGLDTAYRDFDLNTEQIIWLEGLVEVAGARKLVLFSHHQLFSAFESQGRKIGVRLAGLLSSGRITAWYWGHEHRCVVYDQHPAFGVRCRCLGHGGYPYYRVVREDAVPVEGGEGFTWRRFPGGDWPVPGGLLLDGPNPYILGEEEKYGPNGYAVLEFDGPVLRESVCDPTGKVLWEGEL